MSHARKHKTTNDESSLFILLKNSLNLPLFNNANLNIYFSYNISRIACLVIPHPLKNANYITPFPCNMHLGCLWISCKIVFHLL